jgi:hypothetical protein
LKTEPSEYPAERIWRVSEIPKNSDESLDWIDVKVSYNGDSSALQAEALDQYVIPLFKLAPKLLHVLMKTGFHAQLILFSEEEMEIMRRLTETPVYAIGTSDGKGGCSMWWGPSPNLSQALAARPSKYDILFKFVNGKESILARSNGEKWIPQEPEETA